MNETGLMFSELLILHGKLSAIKWFRILVKTTTQLVLSTVMLQF